jgi:hypothetical protein
VAHRHALDARSAAPLGAVGPFGSDGERLACRRKTLWSRFVPAALALVHRRGAAGAVNDATTRFVRVLVAVLAGVVSGNCHVRVA